MHSISSQGKGGNYDGDLVYSKEDSVVTFPEGHSLVNVSKQSVSSLGNSEQAEGYMVGSNKEGVVVVPGDHITEEYLYPNSSTQIKGDFSSSSLLNVRNSKDIDEDSSFRKSSNA